LNWSQLGLLVEFGFFLDRARCGLTGNPFVYIVGFVISLFEHCSDLVDGIVVKPAVISLAQRFLAGISLCNATISDIRRIEHCSYSSA
jgi:hypothetical protein